MATQWPNEGLKQYAKAVVENDIRITTVTPYRINVIVDPQTVFADLNPNQTFEQAINTLGWVINLIGNSMFAVQGVVFNIPSSEAGVTYYGLALYEIASLKLGCVLPFPIPITIPGGGADISNQMNLEFKDCGS